jgi:hypothetical protein
VYDLHGIGSPAADDQFRYTLHKWWGKAESNGTLEGTRLQRVCTLPVADIPRYSLDWFGAFADRVPVANPVLMAVEFGAAKEIRTPKNRALRPGRLPVSPSPQTAFRCQEFGGAG